jgi:hypothetical protein
MRRCDWFDAQPDLEPSQLVFIDETSASTNMARTHGRAPRGQKVTLPCRAAQNGVPKERHNLIRTVRVQQLSFRYAVGFSLQGFLSRRIAERMVTIFRMTATSATFAGFPAARRRS